MSCKIPATRAVIGQQPLPHEHCLATLTECLPSELQTNRNYSPWLGLNLALLSALLIGGSVILKKKALVRLAGAGHTRAGEQSRGAGRRVRALCIVGRENNATARSFLLPAQTKPIYTRVSTPSDRDIMQIHSQTCCSFYFTARDKAAFVDYRSYARRRHSGAPTISV